MAIATTVGHADRLTVANKMAGRGAYIPLGGVVAVSGGLHVISLVFNDARRLVDNWLDEQLDKGISVLASNCPVRMILNLIEAVSAAIRQFDRTCVRRGWHQAAMFIVAVLRGGLIGRKRKRDRCCLNPESGWSVGSRALCSMISVSANAAEPIPSMRIQINSEEGVDVAQLAFDGELVYDNPVMTIAALDLLRGTRSVFGQVSSAAQPDEIKSNDKAATAVVVVGRR